MNFKLDNNITLNYIKKGSGAPLLLLHGNGEDHTIFNLLIEKLERNLTIYAIDSRNHGESSKTNDYSYETMANDVFRFVTNLNLEKPEIVGFSDGAIISLMLTMEHPDLFSKMVLLGVNLKPTDFKEENYNYLVEEYEKSKDPLIKLMLEHPNIELDTLKDIYIPTLIVVAENDLFKSELHHNIVDVMPDASLKIMYGHEHDSYVVASDVLYPILMDFL